MTIEVNYEFQLGTTWTLPFETEDGLTGAELSVIVSQDDTIVLHLVDTDSPTAFIVNSPDVTGSVEIAPDRQDYSSSPDAGIAIQPGTWNYEIRADYSISSPAAGIQVLAYGKIIVQASLFAWPAP